jgi:hypothetical protein
VQHEAGDELLRKVEVEESLGAFEVALEFDCAVEGGGDVRELHGADFDEGEDEAGDELHAA